MGAVGPAEGETPRQPLTVAQKGWLEIIKQDFAGRVFKPYELPPAILRPSYVCRILTIKGYLVAYDDGVTFTPFYALRAET